MAFYTMLLGCGLLTSLSAQTVPDTIDIGTPAMIGISKTVVLSGKITNPASGESLMGATIFARDLGVWTVTNDSGRYDLILPVGQHEVVFRSFGLEEKVKVINLYVNGVVDIGLQERSFSLEEILVKARPSNQNVVDVRSGVVSLNVDNIRELPTLLGELDVLKSLATLPGVSTIGEGAGGINVRGGKVDQNLVLFDNAQLFNTSHALGLFSVFNPDVIQNFTLYKGSVPAQYGGRTSSVLDVEIKKGNFDEFHLKAGLGAISSRVLVEGPLWKGHTSYLLAGRASYANWILKSVERPDIRNSRANFYDLTGVLSHRFNINNTLSLSHYNSYDFFRFGLQFGYQWRTYTTTLKWNSIIRPNFSSSTSLILGGYRNQQFEPQGADAFDYRNGQQYTQLKQNFVWNAGEHHLLNFGAEGIIYKNQPNRIDPRGDQSTVISEEVSRETGREFAVYLNDDFELSPKLALSAGLRYSVFQALGPDQVYLYQAGEPLTPYNIIDTVSYTSGAVINTYNGFEPRFSLRYRLGENGSVKLSYNRMRQYIHLISNTSASTPVDVWQLSTAYIPPQISDNYSLGFFRNFNDNNIETSVEGFYRNIRNLVDYKDFADLLLNEHLETDLLPGKGKAYGLEFLIKKNEGRWSGWLSYTYSRSLVKVDGNRKETQVNGGAWYPSSFDKPHDFTLVAKYEVMKNIFWGINFVYNTGRPITAIVSSYELNNVIIPHFSDRNAYRIPDCYRLDMSLTINGKKLVNRRYRGSFTLSIYNFLARKNAFSVYYQQTREKFIPSATKLSVLGTFIPAISYNFSF
ncbi:MAG: TonB-dependent receptor [Saprospiraceae bacterium]